jgi:hypothetical protein
LGTLVVQRLSPAFLDRAIPIPLLVVAAYVLLKPDLGTADLHPRMEREWFDRTF